MMTKFLKPYFATIAIVLMAISVSCSVLGESGAAVQKVPDPGTYEDIHVSTSNLPLFADLGSFSTKSSGTETEDDSQTVTLESLIDRTKTSSKTFKQYRLTEIPFKSNESPTFAVLSRTDVPSGEPDTEISLFLVETVDTVKNTVDRKVVTIIPDGAYGERNAGNPYSFINKGVFSGVILYADLDGRYRDVYVYGGDYYPIINAEVINPEDASSYRHSCYLSVIRPPVTKGGDDGEYGGELDPSICIADNEEKFLGDINWIGEHDEDAREGGGGGYFPGEGSSRGDSGNPGTGDSSSGGGSDNGSSSGGGGHNMSDGEIGDKIYGDMDGNVEDYDFPWTLPDTDEDIQKYIVSLYYATGGVTDGSGVYQEGSMAFCHAYPADAYVFDRWVGDFHGEDADIFTRVYSDISSTSYFRKLLEPGPVRPCLDTLTGIMNPLIEMSLAPSNTWSSNYKGATFGKTRYKKDMEGNTVPANHNGLDLYVEPGTPIYSMFDGVVNSQIYVTQQPMRSDDFQTNNKYPPGYKGDKDGSGNRIYIDSEVNGEAISVGYWHLLVDTPVAINPRTGEPFKPGDTVYQGEIIAYSGRTGNAYSKAKTPFAHLHLAIKKNGHYIDPEPYINGKLNTKGKDENKVVSSTNITNIKCH